MAVKQAENLLRKLSAFSARNRIQNTEFTTKQMETTWVGIVVVGLIGFALAISGDVVYLISKYKCYRKAIKKQERKAKRELRKAKIIDNK